MDAVDRYARLKEIIRTLEEEAAVLRETFLRPGARLRSNQFEVTIRHQSRRVFLKDNLTSQILNDPKYWSQTTSAIVLVRPLNGHVPQNRPAEALVLVERFS